MNRNFSEVLVGFSPSEVKEIEHLAEERQRIKENKAGLTDKRIADRDNTEMHRVGIMGEYAVSKAIGLPLDSNSYLAGDTRGDFQLYGLWIEVKTALQDLKFNDPPNDFRSDIAVLVIYEKGIWSEVWVQGFIPRKHFDEVSYSDNFGYGPRRCVKPSNLLDIRSIKLYCMMTRNDRHLARKIETAMGVAR